MARKTLVMSTGSWDVTLIGDGPEQGEERFKLLLDTLPHMAFVIFSDGRAEYYNEAFVEYVGRAPVDHHARTAMHHPDDQPAVEAARTAGVAGDGSYVVEARIRRRDGVYRWHRIQNRPVVRGNLRIGYIGTCVDIHDARHAAEVLEQRVGERTAELRASEARYRMLYNRTPLALHSVNAEGLLIDVNDTWTELFGWPRHEIIGRPTSDFMTSDSADMYWGIAWQDWMQANGRERSYEFQFVHRSGRVFDGRLSARGEFDAQGHFIRSWSAIADITAEKRAERQLRQVYRMEAVGQLTAGIAHDFNNLMMAILGSLELLQRQQLDARATRRIDGARKAAERAARLTAQLLAYSRQQQIKAEPVDLNRLLDGMRPLLLSSIGATATVQLRLEPSISTALTDPTQLELALLNLVLNARDAMPTGGTLTIATSNAFCGPPETAEAPEVPGEYVCISVCDTGSGIPESVRERMFEPFYTTKDVGKGSGLGLPQVLGVVKQLGGGIEVRSAPGAGACFLLYLPRAATAPAEPAPAVRPAAPAKQRSLRVMVVDDDPDVLSVSAEMLRAAGHEVTELDSGAAALERLAQIRTDVLVADVGMPGMNGVDLAVTAKRNWPDLKVVFMTGYADQHLLPAASGVHVIRKPFEAAELEEWVARVGNA